MIPVAAVLVDIEGTTTPIRFVHDVLFPYARERLADWVNAHAGEREVAEQLAECARLAPGRPPLASLLQWMAEDAKVTPLKALQGMIWRDGYHAGLLKGEIYPDVAPCLRVWVQAGLRLCVYSSGSVEAQKLIFGHSVAGDLAPLFSAFFDTRVGPKREPDSYGRLAIALNLPPAEILFLSDVEAELDAASAAGLRTCQLVRPQDGTEPGTRHPVAADFPAAARRMGLPAPG
ncbi:MAG: acireductone synthase [Rhodospirillales bacterium]|nr:acireductone synthase [Rhodospirillales bacterium]MDE2197935.1 acireductone synthase [Rhodospirillales bacterium]MDE2576512.1 acireductone synthase [Rhodospirillales bacterium]